MSKISHPFFGEIAQLPQGVDVVWESQLTLNDAEVEASLWASADSDVQAHRLDALAALLQNLDAIDAAARKALRQYLKEDRFYIEDFVENVEDSEVLDGLGDDPAQVSEEAFVAQMQLDHIGLWLEDEGMAVLDYMIDPDASDQILAVKFDESGTVVDVAWEN